MKKFSSMRTTLPDESSSLQETRMIVTPYKDNVINEKTSLQKPVSPVSKTILKDISQRQESLLPPQNLVLMLNENNISTLIKTREI